MEPLQTVTVGPTQAVTPSPDQLNEKKTPLIVRLDDGFFLVRYERASAAERKFLHAMTRCAGPPYPIGKVTAELGKSDQRSISVQRNALIRKGLIYSPRHATVDYTVPRLADFLRRRSDADQ